MELIARLTDPDSVMMFLLLFARMSGIMAFFPFFSTNSFPITIKAGLAFYLCVLFFPIIPETTYSLAYGHIWVAILGEITLGFLASIFLQIAFAIIHFAGQMIAFSMGFSMATAFDPTTSEQNTVIGQVFFMTGTLYLLMNGMDHLVLLFFSKSIELVPLGGFIYNPDVTSYIIRAFSTIFVLGFALAFPISGLVLLADIIFGMIMKTNPQFNLLVFGFPVKIIVAFIILILIVKGFMVVLLKHFNDLFDKLAMFLN